MATQSVTVHTPPKQLVNLPSLRRTGTLQSLRATILLYAPARWGKTHVIRTAKGNVLILACELGDTKGLQTLKDADVPYIVIEDEQTMTFVLAELGRHPDGVYYEGMKFDWIVLDSLSNLGYLWKEAGAEANHIDNMAQASAEGKDMRNVFYYISERGRQHFKRLLDLDAHICAIARETIQEEGEGKSKITYAAPELPGQKLPRELPGWPDATLHGVRVNGQRRFRTQTIAKAVAGIRLPGDINCPELILPDLEAVKDLMLGDKEALVRLTPKANEPPAAVLPKGRR